MEETCGPVRIGGMRILLLVFGIGLWGEVAELNRRGVELVRAGRYAEGEQVLREAVAELTQAEGERTWRLGPVLSNLAFALAQQGEMARAEPVLRRAVYLNGLAPRPDGRQRALDLHNLGSLALQQGRMGEGRRLLLEAEMAWGSERTAEALETQNALVVAAIWSRDLAEAERRLEAARQWAGAETEAVAGSLLMNLGILRGLQGKSAEGMAALGQAVQVQMAKMPARHPALLRTVELYAQMLRRKRDRHGERIARAFGQLLASQPAGAQFAAQCPAEGDCCEYWRRRKRN